MKTIALLACLLFAHVAHAQVYSDSIRVDRPGASDFYVGCDVVQYYTGRLGAYCTDTFTMFDVPPIEVPTPAVSARVVVFAFDYSFALVDEADCLMIGSQPAALGTTAYAVQCGDVVFRDGMNQ